MSKEHSTQGVVLVVLQGKETDLDVVSTACNLAKRKGARLVGLYVLEVPPAVPLGTWDEAGEARGRTAVEAARNVAGQSGCFLEARVLPARHAGQAIVDEAVEWSALGIVMARPHPSRGGEATSYVLDRTVCSVLVWQAERLDSRAKVPPGR